MRSLQIQPWIAAVYAAAALFILIGTAWYSGPHRWLRRILVVATLLLHAVLSCSSIVLSSGSDLMYSWLAIIGSLQFTGWMYWLAQHRSMHLVQLMNLCIAVILIENFMTRHYYGVGLLGWWIR